MSGLAKRLGIWVRVRCISELIGLLFFRSLICLYIDYFAFYPL